MANQTFHRLRVLNASAGVLHFAQGIAMLLLSSAFALPLTTSFLQFDSYTQTLNPYLNTVAEVPIGPLVAAFLFLSAIAHFLLIAPGINEWYVRNLKRGINLARWMEYSLSSSLMIVVIALLVGMYDVATLLVLFFLNTMMILFGWMMEVHNQTTKKTDWTAYIFGCIAGVVTWIAVFIYLIGAGADGGEVPAFVYWIYVSIFLFFNIFALNMLLQYKRVGPWKDYLFGERVYILLSLVAKTLLAWQVFAGTLRPV